MSTYAYIIIIAATNSTLLPSSNPPTLANQVEQHGLHHHLVLPKDHCHNGPQWLWKIAALPRPRHQILPPISDHQLQQHSSLPSELEFIE